MTAEQTTAHRVFTLREIAAMLDSLAALLGANELPRLEKAIRDDSAFIEKVADSIEETL